MPTAIPRPRPRAALRIPARGDDVQVRAGSRTVALTNLDKVFWPEAGFTKRALLQYYADVSSMLLLGVPRAVDAGRGGAGARPPDDVVAVDQDRRGQRRRALGRPRGRHRRQHHHVAQAGRSAGVQLGAAPPARRGRARAGRAHPQARAPAVGALTTAADHLLAARRARYSLSRVSVGPMYRLGWILPRSSA